MPDADTPAMMSELLGSVQVFSSAVRTVLEDRLLCETARGRITFSGLKLLKLVAFNDSSTVGDVAAFLGVSNTAASKAVDKLVRRRLLRRAEGHIDRRASELSLTGEGRRLLHAYEAARDQKLTEIFGAATPEELGGMAATLDRLSAHLVDHTANPQEVCFQCGIYFREKCRLKELVKRTCFYEKHKARKAAESVAAGADETTAHEQRPLPGEAG
jgi:DNA-binding MarR family transcriptional regulator